MTTRWPRRSTASTKPSSSDPDLGAAPPRSNWPPGPGSIGGTIAASTRPAGTYHRRNTRPLGSPAKLLRPRRRLGVSLTGGPELLLDRRASTPRTPNCPANSQTTPEGTPLRLSPGQSEQGEPHPSRTTTGPPRGSQVLEPLAAVLQIEPLTAIQPAVRQ